MATYVPGSQIYARETQPFTPDYKFLSNVLDVRQDRYDTNYKQLSDLYGRVVYADLSRQDTTEMRDQYANQLAPKIQQISGMDLSLRQNVDAAQGLFKPFYEDDLIVKDLVYTKQFKKNVQLAQVYKDSDNLDQRKKYWGTGMQYLNYQMEDFKTADRDGALKQALPTYVENVDLMAMSTKLLEEAGFEDVKIDIPSDDGAWIITEKNGQQQVPGAYNYLQKTLLEDPRVIDAYRASGYVQSRSFAEAGVESGQYANISEGQNAWARQTLQDLAQRNATANEILKRQFEDALDTKENWEAYEKEEGIVPGSDEAKAMMDALEHYDKLNGALQRNEEDMQRLDNTSLDDDLLSKAYNLLMSYNISSDILGAAQAYSMRDYERTLEANPYKKMEIEHIYDMAEINQRHLNKMKEIEHKAKIDPSTKEGAIANLVDMIWGGNAPLDAQSTQFEEAEDPIARNAEDAANFANKTLEEQVAFITEMDKLSKTGKSIQDVDLNRMTIKLADGTDYTGSYDQIRSKLLEKDESGTLVNSPAISTLYKDSKLKLETLPETNPKASELPAYVALTGAQENIRARESMSLDYEETYSQVLFDNMKRIRTTDKGKEINSQLNNGVPSIITADPKAVLLGQVDAVSGAGGSEFKPRLLSKTEFQDIYVSRVRNKAIRGIDDDAYMVRERRYDASTSMRKGAGGDFTHNYTYVTYFDEDAARREADKLYDDQYAALGGSLNEAVNTSLGGARVTQPFSADAYFRGVPLDQMNASELYTYRGYQETFNVENLNNPDAVSMLMNLVKQHNETANKIIVATGASTAEEVEAENDPTAAYIFEKTLLDTKRAMLTPDKASSKNLLYDITYNPVKTVDGESYASYTLKLTRDQIQQFADTPDKQNKITKEISTSDIVKYSEITMLVPMDQDMNPRAAGNYNFSAIDFQINMSDEKVYNYNLLSNKAGSFKIFNDGGLYYVAMEMMKVNPETGLFETAGIQSPTIIVNDEGQPVTKANIDRYAAHYRRTMEEIYKQNIEQQKAWKKKNGIKK
jgi:hypothetical protein